MSKLEGLRHYVIEFGASTIISSRFSTSLTDLSRLVLLIRSTRLNTALVHSYSVYSRDRGGNPPSPDIPHHRTDPTIIESGILPISEPQDALVDEE